MKVNLCASNRYWILSLLILSSCFRKQEIPSANLDFEGADKLINEGAAPQRAEIIPSDILVLIVDNQAYTLKNDNKGFHWEKASAKTLAENPAFQLKEGVKKTLHGYARIQDKKSVEVSVDGKEFWDSGVSPALENQEYTDVYLDSMQNKFVELGGEFSGLNYISANGAIAAFAGVVPWENEPPTLVKKVGNPHGVGLIGYDIEGVLWQIMPPMELNQPMRGIRLSQPGFVDELVARNNSIFILTPQGKFGFLNENLQMDNLLTEIKIPKGKALELAPVIFSSNDPHAKQMLDVRLNEPKLDIPVAKVDKKPPTTFVEEMSPHRPAGPFLGGTKRFVTDDIAKAHFDGKEEEIAVWGREEEARRVFRTFVREKGKNPVLVGKAGTGKTAVADLVAQMLFAGKIPDADAFQGELKDAIVVETSPQRINRLNPMSPAAAVEMYIESLKYCEKTLKRRIVVFVDEMHTFKAEQLEALKTTFDSRDGILFLGSTTFGEFNMMLDLNPALERRLQTVEVREFSLGDTRALMRQVIIPRLEKRYGGENQSGKIEDDAVDAILRLAPQYLPSKARPEAPYKLALDALIWKHEKSGKKAPVLTAKDVGQFLTETMKLPLNPADPVSFYRDLEKIRAQLRERVVDQGHYTDAMVDSLRDIYLGTDQKDSVAIILGLGPTGAGKTFGAMEFAKLVFGSEERLLEIDATKYLAGGVGLGTLIGVGRGIVSGTETKGVLPDFLSGPGKGANVIVINEIDKAHPDFMKVIMEMLDSGKLQGGNGETFYLGKSIVIFTSNKGDEQIFPRGTLRALSRKDLEERLARFTDAKVKELFTQPGSDNLYDRQNLLPPSILGRIKRAKAILPPSREGAITVARQSANKLIGDLKDQYAYTISVDDKLLERIVDKNYVPENGVRNITNIVQDVIKSSLMEIVKNELPLEHGTKIQLNLGIDENADKLQISTGERPSLSLAHKDLTPRSPNPLSDPEESAKLNTMEERLSNHVFGQDHGIPIVAQKLVAKGLLPKDGSSKNKKPVTFLFLGNTGIGKTELAKAIALEYYGSADRIAPFDLGGIQKESDVNEIFGSKRGYIGSDTPPPFEEALVNFPEGAVLLLDEIGSIGGDSNPGVTSGFKNKILKMFYSMTDEGRWRSPLGKVYDLSNHVIIFTSNEGQELTQGLPSDDLRMAVWENSHDQETITEILKSHGWPEALTGRLSGGMILFKPLMAEHRLAIAKKAVDRAVSDLVTNYQIKNIDYDETFLEVISESFFSHTSGARSMGALAEGPINALLSKLILKIRDPAAIASAQFKFGIQDNYFNVMTFPGAKPPKRVVTLTIEASFEGKESVKVEADVADIAAKKNLRKLVDLRRTAYHEAGHVVGNDTAVTGIRSDFVTIVGKGNYGGYARSVEDFPPGSVSREYVVAHIAMVLSGRAAEKLMGFEPDAGWRSDWEKARDLATKAVVEYGLVSNPLTMAIGKENKINIEDKKVQNEVKQLMLDAEQYAEARLKNNWPALYLIYSQLMKDYVLDGERIQEVLTYAESEEYKAALNSKGLVLPQPKIAEPIGVEAKKIAPKRQ